jgi:hypothetical protein
MTKSSNFLGRSVAAVCTAMCLASSASAVDLRDWGRKFPTAERFVVLAQFSNQAVLDKETQLVWQAKPAGTAYVAAKATWMNAVDYCHRATTGGRRGWRLPTFAEIASIWGTDGLKPAAFIAVPDDLYWTASVVYGNAYAALIQLPSGTTSGHPEKIATYRYLCVRGAA